MNFWNSIGSLNSQDLDEEEDSESEEQYAVEEELGQGPTAADNLSRRGHEVRSLLVAVMWDLGLNFLDIAVSRALCAHRDTRPTPSTGAQRCPIYKHPSLRICGKPHSTLIRTLYAYSSVHRPRCGPSAASNSF